VASYETPVLIVGGGGFGLSTSIFLSNLGVESLLVERHAAPSPMPKARYLNQRTMEIFRQQGLAQAIYDRAVPIRHMATTRWVTSLGGNGPHDRKLLYEMETFGGGSLAAHYQANSPCESAIYPQVRLEPLLRAHAEDLRSGRLLFNHALQGLTQDAHGVTAQVEDRATGEVHTVRPTAARPSARWSARGWRARRS
jgi:2,4-dichlorophenol 6-monooxygenase